jgi:NADPH:quinone reductase-like Zn-dependent oxidoreductase
VETRGEELLPGSRVLVIGATGMVGGLVLRFALDRPDVASVTVIGRQGNRRQPSSRPVGTRHPPVSFTD